MIFCEAKITYSKDNEANEISYKRSGKVLLKLHEVQQINDSAASLTV